MFRASSVPIFRNYQLYTWQLVCFMQVMWPLPRRARFQPDSRRQRPHNLHETYQLLRVQLITPDDGHRGCPKHVEFRDKVQFWILDASCWLFIWRSLWNICEMALTKEDQTNRKVSVLVARFTLLIEVYWPRTEPRTFVLQIPVTNCLVNGTAWFL
jgi:hypothetical protein